MADDPMFQRFVWHPPITGMVRATLEKVFAAENLDKHNLGLSDVLEAFFHGGPSAGIHVLQRQTARCV